MRTGLQYYPIWAMVAAVGLMASGGTALAASNAITYQGTLVDPSGNIATDGVYSIYFSVWDALAGGSKLWEETNLMVTVTKGAFAVELGLKTAFGTIFDDGASRWLEIAVDFTGTGEQAFTPRVPLSMVPFARKAAKAGDADLLDGLDSLAFALTGHVHNWGSITGKPTTFPPDTHAHSGAQITSGMIGLAYLPTGAGSGLNADLLDGSHAAAFSLATHVHSGAQITSGKVANAYLNTGAGAGLDADLLDGNHASSFAAASHTQAWSTITSIPAGSGDVSGTYPGLTVTRIQGNSVQAGVPGSGQVLKWSGTAWAPGTDNDSTNADTLDTLHAISFWNTLGNAGAVSGTNFLGTTDNIALDLRVNNQRALRIEPSAISPNLISGSSSNNVTAGAAGATIGGGGSSGFSNVVTDNYGVVGGGINNKAGDGAGSAEDSRYATVGGGYINTAGGESATVGGGNFNTASSQWATVAGGYDNTAGELGATVGGGYHGNATGLGATVCGGNSNTASGEGAVVCGGTSNIAGGMNSFAGGAGAKALHDACFVWADGNGTPPDSTGYGQFRVRAVGGVWFFTGNGVGATLAAGSGSWTSASDRNAKENFEEVDCGEVLDKVAGLPITKWNYKAQDKSIRHVGPMAQDVYAAFGVGETDTGITTVDADGVALAAIQGLNQRLVQSVEAKDQDIAALRAEKDQEIAALRAEKDRENAALRAELQALKALVNTLVAK